MRIQGLVLAVETETKAVKVSVLKLFTTMLKNASVLNIFYY
jgi:hypothetical protein